MSNDRGSAPRPSGVLLFVTALLGAIAMLGLPSLHLSKPLWDLRAPRLIALLCLTASFLLAVTILSARQRGGRRASWGEVLAVLGLAFAPTLAFMLLKHSDL